MKDQLDSVSAPLQAPGIAAAAAAAPAPTVEPLVGRGFAQIATQPGKTHNEKRLLAIRAARLEAMRDLTEQIHGIALQSSTNMTGSRIEIDQLAARISGTLRGAKTRRITRAAPTAMRSNWKSTAARWAISSAWRGVLIPMRALALSLCLLAPPVAATAQTLVIDVTGQALQNSTDDQDSARRRALADALLQAAMAGGKGHGP
ncbi:hypothetical protein ACFSHQ_13420 [Gemmobacter lanyuensis]